MGCLLQYKLSSSGGRPDNRGKRRIFALFTPVAQIADIKIELPWAFCRTGAVPESIRNRLKFSK